MKKTIAREIVVCDYCDILLGDSDFAFGVRYWECVICGKHTCKEHGAQVYYEDCSEGGKQLCRNHLPEMLFKDEVIRNEKEMPDTLRL